MFTRRIVIAALAVVACAVPASATITYDTTPAQFTIDTSGMTSQSVTFSPLGIFGSPLTFNGVSFVGFNADTTQGNLSVLSVPPSNASNWTQGVLLAPVAGGAMTITFPTNVRAFSFFASYPGSFNPLVVTVTSADANSPLPESVSVGFSLPNFWGFITDQQITSVTLTPHSGTDQIMLGAFLFDTPNVPQDPVPESGSLFLIGTGLALLPLLHRRFSRKRT